MCELRHAEKRTTRRYNPDYAYLDNWEALSWSWSELRFNNVYRYDDDDGYTQLQHILIKGDAILEDVYEVLRDNNLRGCSCEHDCCGHYFGGVRGVTRLNDHEYIIESSYSRNY